MRRNMKAERARKGMSAKQVADAVGVHENAVRRWETGEAEPMGSNLVRLSRLYGCYPQYHLQQTSYPSSVAVSANDSVPA